MSKAATTRGCTSPNSPAWRLRLLFTLYNLVIHPLFHWLLELLPFVEMGVTRYKPLATVAAIDGGKPAFLRANIERYRRRLMGAKVSAISDERCVDLPAVSETYRGQRLLRYPLLMRNDSSAQTLIARSKLEGCGLSPLYQRTLDGIDEANRLVTQRAGTNTAFTATNAMRFAQRLVTLPEHQHARQRQRQRIAEAMLACTPSSVAAARYTSGRANSSATRLSAR